MTQTQICDEYIQSSSPAGEIFELAQKNHCRPQEIAQIIIENGIDLPEGWPLEEEHPVESIFTPERDDWILRLTSEGIKPASIAEMVGLQPKQIRNRLGVLKRRGNPNSKTIPSPTGNLEMTSLKSSTIVVDYMDEIDKCLATAMAAVLNPNQRTRAAGLMGIAIGEIRVLKSLFEEANTRRETKGDG